MLNGGNHEASRLITLLRNQIGFHWDPSVISVSLKDFTSHERVVWVEGKTDSTAELVNRLSADVLMNALWPESRDQAMTKEQRQAEMLARTAAGFTALAQAVADASSFIHYVLIGFFIQIKPKTHTKD